MGSPLRLTIAGRIGRGAVDGAWAEVRDEFELAEMALSRYRESSEITQLARGGGLAGFPRAVSRRLRIALAAADRAVRITAGRFDPRIVEDLERLGFAGVSQGCWSDEARGRPPATGTTDGGDGDRGRVFGLDPRGGVVLSAAVDFGGIGKGLALRWASTRLERSLAATAADGYLLDAGGDLVASGSPGAGEAWSVGIEDPAGTGLPVAVVAVRHRGSVTTSSTRIQRRTAEDGRLVHHLIDPRLHAPADGGLLAVTVAGPDPAWSEVWSKALFVEGRQGIAALARRHGLAAWWVADDGTLEMTPGARATTTWVREEAAVQSGPGGLRPGDVLPAVDADDVAGDEVRAVAG